ncbi:DUF2461 domain-containing protein [Mucilaginibacter limnophilus]|uniref:DUF2461 domain-containing protein n=1 Tax=Mucilaginibacter limnophilus TaxID=1932778 RepID=A0A437MVA9_9SPHI|nr:DUF2461 domain-containing protein [Mucilaginibacter limnophilus]RVU01557.1 DUF2461 domain-containing protein [Mucilaginibacter limnophilus]
MITKETLQFLKDIKENNNRDWFMANKQRHDDARANVIDFAAEVVKLLSKVDPKVKEDTDVRKCVLRIYRDIRFSPDKTPYKRNFGISVLQNPGGGRGPEYYIQIEPGKSFVAGGYWMPESAHVKAIRQEIDYNADELKQIIDAPEFVKLFGNFRDQDKLKTLPRDYSADNENIDLLKLKSYIAVHQLKDDELLKKDSAAKVAEICSKIYPLNVFLNNALS